MRIVLVSGIALLMLACAGWVPTGETDASDPEGRSRIPALDPVPVLGPAPGLSEDCASFGGFPVPASGGEPLRDCQPDASSVTYHHPLPEGGGKDPKGASEAYIAQYAARASEAGWARVDSESGDFRYRNPAYAGWSMQIAAHREDDSQWSVMLIARPDKR